MFRAQGTTVKCSPKYSLMCCGTFSCLPYVNGRNIMVTVPAFMKNFNLRCKILNAYVSKQFQNCENPMKEQKATE